MLTVIVARVRAGTGPALKARLKEALSSGRGKISTEVAGLIEAGFGVRRGVWSWQRRELEKAMGSGVTSAG